MARLHQCRSWRRALATGTVCGLVLSGAMLQAETPRSSGDSTEVQPVKHQSKPIVRDTELDATIQKLGVTTAKSGSSSYHQRKQSTAEMPLDELDENGQLKVKGILNNLAMFRRLPTLTFECDPEIYQYFLANPDVAVASWRAMEISKFQLKQSEPDCFEADAGDGSVGKIEILRSTPEDTIIYCDGSFKSPLLPKPIVARSLMRLQTTFSKESDGRCIGTHTGDVFVEFPSQAVETVAKVIAPVSHSIADRNFKQMTLFIHLMTQAVAKHPGWVELIGRKLDGVTSEQRAEFMEVTAKGHAVSKRRIAVPVQTKSFVPDEVLTPFRKDLESGETAVPAISERPGVATLRN